MQFCYTRLAAVDGSPTFDTLVEAAAAVDLFCGVTQPLLLMRRTQRVYINRECVAIPAFPLGGPQTYREPGEDSDITDIEVTQRHGGTLAVFPRKYAGTEIDVSGYSGYGITVSSGWVLPAPLSATATTISDANGFAAVEVGDVLQIEDELVLVSAKGTSPEFTLIRSVADTTAAEHPAGYSTIRLVAPPALQTGAARVAVNLLSRKRVPTSGGGGLRLQDGQRRRVEIDKYGGADEELRQYVALGRPF